MDMVERVARALADEARFIYERNPERWNDAAIAAIEAMREPTEGMTAAFDEAYAEETACNCEFRNGWHAAIDSILKRTRETA
jgi:hypothetical protein